MWEKPGCEMPAFINDIVDCNFKFKSSKTFSKIVCGIIGHTFERIIRFAAVISGLICNCVSPSVIFLFVLMRLNAISFDAK